MKAVLWTDAFQVIMMMIGLLATLIEGSIRADGFQTAWKSAEATGRVFFGELVIINKFLLDFSFQIDWE